MLDPFPPAASAARAAPAKAVSCCARASAIVVMRVSSIIASVASRFECAASSARFFSDLTLASSVSRFVDASKIVRCDFLVFSVSSAWYFAPSSSRTFFNRDCVPAAAFPKVVCAVITLRSASLLIFNTSLLYTACATARASCAARLISLLVSFAVAAFFSASTFCHPLLASRTALSASVSSV